MIQVRLTTAADLPRVQELYRTLGYPREISATDRVIVAEEGAQLIGVLRLVREEGITVLRGVRVIESRQRSGLGARLLQRLADVLGDEACTCIAYRHLIGFYGRIGFREVEPAGAPPFLVERLSTYRRERPDVQLCILHRPASARAARA